MELLAGFSALQLAAALVTGLVASFIRGLAGFGLAIILVPVLALALTPVEAVLTTNVVAMLIGGIEMPRLLREAEKSAWTIIGLVLLTTLPGLVVLAATPPDIARLLIALVALSAFFAVLFPVREAKQPGMPMVSSGIIACSSPNITKPSGDGPCACKMSASIVAPMMGSPAATNVGVGVGAAQPPGTEVTAAASNWDQLRLTFADVEPDDPEVPEIELLTCSDSTTPAGPTITSED